MMTPVCNPSTQVLLGLYSELQVGQATEGDPVFKKEERRQAKGAEHPDSSRKGEMTLKGSDHC